MIRRPFEYTSATSAEHAAELLAPDPEATRVIGGGTWVVPEMNRGESLPRRVVDLGRAGMSGVERSNGHVRVGATTSYADVLASDDAQEHLGLLVTMAGGITGGWTIRRQGTLGGSAISARPQSDVPAVVSALGGEAVLRSANGERRIAPAELFAGAMLTSLAPGEILVAFEFPSRSRAGHGYHKLKRSASSWPIATAAALVELDGTGRCSAVALVLGGVSATPLFVDLDDLLLGAEPTEERVAESARRAGSRVTDPWGDVLAPASYRATVAAPVARRALTNAVANARRHAEGN